MIYICALIAPVEVLLCSGSRVRAVWRGPSATIIYVSGSQINIFVRPVGANVGIKLQVQSMRQLIFGLQQ